MLLPPLIFGTLIQRYKRFLADVRLEDGTVVTAHCPNSGSMLGCAEPGSVVALSRSDNPRRKLSYTWELVQVDGNWIGINTFRTNGIVEEAVAGGAVPELQGYACLRREVRYGHQRSRIDLLLEDDQRGRCYVEVKSVTLKLDGRACFPDAVTTRGQKHTEELMAMVAEGHRAVVFFLVQRSDVECFTPADAIDRRYGQLLRQALQAGVEVCIYGTEISPASIVVAEALAGDWRQHEEQQT
ncbi:sugar fermentation stimulation protein [Desulfurispirillum indicum S5]|uniref:Sugar fermentation stimulation protein homolog n=1 Tax=Desulfurispirillum indicum (strain ATCC BAA-1389 / DSM 22839 / S5) TaxID=653733 RepID=E6W407_DESIS|nr:DNA/RNA nuclease SfsA [Desulfurispirillum indicum]ADU66971.1 sugar fermentation stimulation protein [Desulfurispirillum indicum S5]